MWHSRYGGWYNLLMKNGVIFCWNFFSLSLISTYSSKNAHPSCRKNVTQSWDVCLVSSLFPLNRVASFFSFRSRSMLLIAVLARSGKIFKIFSIFSLLFLAVSLPFSADNSRYNFVFFALFLTVLRYDSDEGVRESECAIKLWFFQH